MVMDGKRWGEEAESMFLEMWAEGVEADGMEEKAEGLAVKEVRGTRVEVWPSTKGPDPNPQI